ncbi:hypothetical protein [Stenotrophomonas indicatrix]|uniref:hypothetical protein n=1 Tax=Stenotrophomonas indicatrix TaxID=2045451 RepID=UPI003D6C7E8D
MSDRVLKAPEHSGACFLQRTPFVGLLGETQLIGGAYLDLVDVERVAVIAGV